RTINDAVFKASPPKAQEGKSVRDECLEEMTSLEKRERKDLSPGDCMNLSACYVRLGRPNKAIALLETQLKDVSKDEPYRFLLEANLAMAYWDDGVASRAIHWQRESMAHWPTHFKGWTW